MNFHFKLNNILRNEITKIDNRLIPDGFNGDRRSYRTCVQSISEILDEMGIASAKAQGLQKPITSSEKLRNSDHVVYLLTESDSVLGFLKMGRKNLFVFDEMGKCHENYTLCVLDFYVHETRQRMGCGKKLFEYMLLDEDIIPERLAIDRPSEKFLLFLRKHYGLNDAVQQNNNFVVFSGFFPKNGDSVTKKTYSSYGTRSPYSDGNAVTYNGRHTAFKRETTMGQIIQTSPMS